MLIICSINVVRSWLFLLYFCFFFIAVFLILLLFLTVQYLSANFSFIFAVGWAHVICALYIPEVRFGDVHSMDPVILNDVPLERFFFWSLLNFFVYLLLCLLLVFFFGYMNGVKKKKTKRRNDLLYGLSESNRVWIWWLSRVLNDYRFQQPCYLCTERGDRKQALQGACMSCNKLGCKKVSFKVIFTGIQSVFLLFLIVVLWLFLFFFFFSFVGFGNFGHLSHCWTIF